MGFNDSGAEVTTMASGRGVSMDGYAQSSNRGATFTYMGSPATPSDPNTFMSGDPAVACANAATYYYVSSFLDGTKGISGVSLSTSSDGGKTFVTPVVIAQQPTNSHIVDGAWVAVDRAIPGRLRRRLLLLPLLLQVRERPRSRKSFRRRCQRPATMQPTPLSIRANISPL